MEPVRTGIWKTTGVANLPLSERFRWLRASSTSEVGPKEARWKPEFLDVSAWHGTLEKFRKLGLLSEEECANRFPSSIRAFHFLGPCAGR